MYNVANICYIYIYIYNVNSCSTMINLYRRRFNRVLIESLKG